MKIGSLVELSASAKKLKWTSKYRGKIGVVTWVNIRHDWYKVSWVNASPIFNNHEHIMGEMFSRGNLKHAKKR